ncbi:MAG: YraN family protein [Patescibacteria group bacterium]
MSNYKIRLGKFGEQLAAEFLKRNGYKIIDKNFYTPFGEIDLIAESGDEILFVEVKARSGEDFGYPEVAVDRRKTSHLLKTIGLYLERKNLNNFWRLDIISVEIDRARKVAKVKWFKGIG